MSTDFRATAARTPSSRSARGSTAASPYAAAVEAAPAAAPLPAAVAALHDLVIDWFDGHARDLPWRRPDAGAWSVMVSEFMLQQTPVSRVLPVHAEWLARWPRPADLAGEAPGEAVRAWGGSAIRAARCGCTRRPPP